MGNQSSIDMTDYQRQGLNKIKGNQPRNNLKEDNKMFNYLLIYKYQKKKNYILSCLHKIIVQYLYLEINERLTYNNVNRRIDRFEQDASIRREQFEKEQQEIKNFFEKKKKEKEQFETELNSFEDEYDPYKVLNISNNAYRYH